VKYILWRLKDKIGIADNVAQAAAAYKRTTGQHPNVAVMHRADLGETSQVIDCTEGAVTVRPGSCQRLHMLVGYEARP